MDPGAGPEAIRTVAVATADVVAALAHNRRNDEDAVLRVTPPFHGRMRARLHLDVDPSPDRTPSPVRIPPERLVDGERVPPLPGADETRPPADEYSVEDHHDRHVGALEAWREAVRGAVVDEVELPAPGGPVEVAALG